MDEEDRVVCAIESAVCVCRCVFESCQTEANCFWPASKQLPPLLDANQSNGAQYKRRLDAPLSPHQVGQLVVQTVAHKQPHTSGYHGHVPTEFTMAALCAPLEQQALL